MMGPDGWIDLYLSRYSLPAFLEPFFLLLNKLGKGDTLAFLCILLIIFGYIAGRSQWIKSGSGGILTLLFLAPIVQPLKHLFGRARPQLQLGDLHFIGPNLIKNGFDSFPSGHATTSFAVAAFFSCYYPNLKILFYLIALSISILGRVVLRHHFLSDVIVGGIIGVGVGLFSAKKAKQWFAPPDLSSQETAPPPSGKEGEIKERKLNLKELGAILFFSTLILFWGLNNSALWDRDETEYAQAAIEMRQKNEWLIPTLEGKPFIEKPILLYWFLRISYAIFGVTEFSSRLPSVLFGVFTCVATYFLSRALWAVGGGGGNKTAIFSALILSSSFIFAGGFRLLLTDPIFVFFTLLSCIFYVHSHSSFSQNRLKKSAQEQSGRSKIYLTLSYASIGCAALAKGPIAFFPVIVFLIFEWLAQKPSLQEVSALREHSAKQYSSEASGARPLGKDFMLRNLLCHLPFLALAISIAAPWFLYSLSLEKEATKTFFLYDNIHRFLKGSEGHTGTMLYYVSIILFGFFPWSFFAVPAIRKEWKDRSSKKSPMELNTLFLSIWIAFIFIFFSLSAHKLPHYIFPALPPLACLIGKFWNDQTLEPLPLSSAQTSLKIPFFAAILTSICFLFVPAALYLVRPQYASIRLLVPFSIFLIFLSAAYFLSTKGAWQKGFVTICMGSLAFFLSVSTMALPWIEKHRVMKPIGLAIKKNVPAGSKIYGYHISEPSLFIYGERLFPIIENVPLNTILSQPHAQDSSQAVYLVIKESLLKKSLVRSPYTILERKEGFAENGGEMTLLLITNQ